MISTAQCPKAVKIVEVSPRDGLQNEAKLVPTEVKLELIQRLSKTGLTCIEASSFVTAAKIPQLADAEQLYRQLDSEHNIDYPALVPNLKGLERALSVGVKSISVFVAASETFSKKNINVSIAESMERVRDIMQAIKNTNIKVRAYISCVLGCPYEGDTDFSVTAILANELLQLGCYEISLGDTIGIGTPRQVQDLLMTCFSTGISVDNLAVHFHDTYGQALANIYAALELGIAVVDSSVSGLGGCPYARGASGNVATEDVLYLLNGLGIKTGIDLKKLIEAGQFISKFLEKPTQSKVAVALS